jgi:hypothetical protein
MMAAALFIVLAAAKAATLAGHWPPQSGWAPAAYLWHDAALVGMFALLEHRCRRRPQFVAGRLRDRRPLRRHHHSRSCASSERR